MTEHYLQKVSVEPDWCGLYVDGELFREGHDYESESHLIEAINNHEGDMSVDTYGINPEEWHGLPDTFEELEDMYEF